MLAIVSEDGTGVLLRFQDAHTTSCEVTDCGWLKATYKATLSDAGLNLTIPAFSFNPYLGDCEVTTFNFDASGGSISATEIHLLISGSYDVQCPADGFFKKARFHERFEGTAR